VWFQLVVCAGWKRSQSVGWLEKNLGVVGTAGAGAVTEMEVLLLHSAWFRLELCAAACSPAAISWLAGKKLGVVGFLVVEFILLVDLRGYEASGG